MKKPKLDTPREGSWMTTVNTPTTQEQDIARLKNSPVIFWCANQAWFAKKWNVTYERARELIGYPKPLATISLAEYRATRFAG